MYCTHAVTRVVVNKELDDKRNRVPVWLQQEAVFPYVKSGASGGVAGSFLALVSCETNAP